MGGVFLSVSDLERYSIKFVKSYGKCMSGSEKRHPQKCH